MSTDKENWRDNYDDSDTAGRDGNSYYNRDNNYNRDYNREGSDRPRNTYNKYNNDRPSRPRINREGSENRPGYNRVDRPQRTSYNRDGNSYNSYNRDRNNNSYSQDRPQRSSYNRDSYGNEDRSWRQNSDNNRGDRQQGFRKPTPNSGGGSYSNNENSYRSNNNSYRSSGNSYNNRGSYNSGGSYNRDGNDGRPRRPRFNSDNNSYNNRGGGQGGFRPRTQGYDPNAKYTKKKQIEYKEQYIDPDTPIRLNKYLANAGICSRREADEFITAGVVSVNGEIIKELGTKIKRGDSVKFHDQDVSIERKVYVILNKPKDCVTTADDPQERRTVMDLVKDACQERIYPVGRLDRNTTGVLLLTNDGDLASKLTHPKFMKKKIYHVYLDKNLSTSDMEQIAAGVQLEDGEIKADHVEYASDRDKSQVGIEIHSGKNRIVRRIFETLGYKVIKLDRVYFAGLTKKNLRRGDWRFLSEQEVNFLRMGSFE